MIRFAMPPSLGMDGLFDRVGLLRDALTDLLVVDVDVTVSQSYESLTRNLLSGAVDAAHAPPFVCAQVEPQGVVIAARAVRHGRASYGSALVRKKGTDVSLSRPKGIRAAWVDRRSVAGYLLPVAHLKTSRRLDTSRHFASEEFFGSYPAALAAVLDGRADLCAVHSQRNAPETVREAAAIHAPGRADDVELVEMTDEVPGDGIAVATEKYVEMLRDAFIHLEKEALGKRLLKEVFVAERFELAKPHGYRALYAVAPKDL